MTLHEYVGNMHMHTPYSDGFGYHAEIAQSARSAGLDFIVVTDHNIYVQGVEGYYGDDETGYVLLLAGEEVHDRTRLPQVNHCLVYNAKREMCHYAQNPQGLIDEVAKVGGLTFLAHPDDKLIPFMQPLSNGIAIPWVDWNLQGFIGLEIWNYMSRWKDSLPTVRQAVKGVFRPEEVMSSPSPATLARWDHLLAKGLRVVGIGNSDAHGMPLNLGFLKQTIFAYDFLFNCVNTHILSRTAFSGDAEFDRNLIYDALRSGRAFIGYEMPGSTRGFRFSAQGMEGSAEMGDSLRLFSGVTLQVKTPQRGHIKVIRYGEVLAEDTQADALVYTAREAGAYRVEVWREYKGQPRCWILSNPIYILP